MASEQIIPLWPQSGKGLQLFPRFLSTIDGTHGRPISLLQTLLNNYSISINCLLHTGYTELTLNKEYIPLCSMGIGLVVTIFELYNILPSVNHIT